MRSLPGCEIVEYTMKEDHVHMVMIIPPKYAVGDVIGKIKGQTASQLRKKFSWLGKVCWKENVVWSRGYFVSSVGIDEARVLKYIEWQQSQDLGQEKLEF
jgi:putative transposase